MSYTLPSLTVQQQLSSVLSVDDQTLAACIVAPHYGLHRYSVASEQALAGAYDPVNGNVFAYPGKATGSVIDLTYNKVFIKNAIAQYYSGSFTGSGNDGVTVNGGNRVRSSSLVFQTANGSARSSVFGTRDVAIGDYIKCSYGGNTVASQVVGLVADQTAAAVGTAAASATNKTSTSLANTVTATTISNTHLTVTGSATSYNGLPSGYLSESYVVTITAVGATMAGTTAKVVSSSGTDNVSSMTLLATGSANAVGTRGATFTVADSGSDNLFVVGDTFTVNVTQAFTPRVPTAAGSFTGSANDTYVVRILQGGTVGTTPVVFDAYTLNGTDTAAAQTASAAGTFVLGNLGVTVALTSAHQYCAGDSFTVAVTAAAPGAVRTLVLSNKLTSATTSTAITFVLGVYDDIELGNGYFVDTASNITVGASAQTLGTYLGSSQEFSVIGGTIYIEYRELLQTYAKAVGSISGSDDPTQVVGPAVVDNPLGLLVYKAYLNAAGQTIYFAGVATDSTAGYQSALDMLTSVEGAYSIVPFSSASAVRSAVQAHVNSMSSATVCQWRIGWVANPTSQSAARYSKLADGTTILATVNGTSNLTVTASGALFITNGVQAGDVLRIGYGVDAYGNATYSSYTIASVTSETTLTLVSGPSASIPVAIHCEVWYTMDNSAFATAAGADAGQFASRRMYDVWSDTLSDDTGTLPISALCAALAGLRSSVAPHQPLTRVSVSGFTISNDIGLTMDQMNTMAGAGVWLVVKNNSGVVYTRHQVSTDPTDSLTREQSITTNLDDISYYVRSGLDDFYGKGNVSDQMLELIRTRVVSIQNELTSRTWDQTLGPQLQGLKIGTLARDATNRNRINLVLDPVLPDPLNNLNVTIAIS